MVIWSLKRDEKNKGKQIIKDSLSSGLIVKRVLDTSAIEASSMVVTTAHLAEKVLEREAKEKEELTKKFEQMLRVYGDLKQGLFEKHKIIADLKRRLGEESSIQTPQQLQLPSSTAGPSSSSPIIEFPMSPLLPSLCSEDIE